MKKLSLVLLMVFATSWVMAQNNVGINQTGGAGNTAYTNQNNSGNDLAITQYINGSTGTNIAGTDLSNPILQDGSNNEAKLVQQVNGPLGVPSNEAKIKQVGTGNYLVGANATATTWNVNAKAEQIAKDYSNFLDAYQKGAGNVIGLSQHSDGANAFGYNGAGGEVSQIGDNNALVVVQTALTSGSASFVWAGSQQKGDNNIARVLQSTNSGQNIVNLNQNGNGNMLVDADASGYLVLGAATQMTSLFATSNNLKVDQTGNNNIAGVHQETIGGVGYTNANDAIISQNGGDHASVYQIGAGTNMANVIQ